MKAGAKRSYRIRRVRVNDASEFARLTTELGYPATAAQIAPRLRALLPLTDHFVAVAEETRGHLVGWIAAERRLLLSDEPRIEIVGLVVAERGKAVWNWRGPRQGSGAVGG